MPRDPLYYLERLSMSPRCPLCGRFVFWRNYLAHVTHERAEAYDPRIARRRVVSWRCEGGGEWRPGGFPPPGEGLAWPVW